MGKMSIFLWLGKNINKKVKIFKKSTCTNFLLEVLFISTLPE